MTEERVEVQESYLLDTDILSEEFDDDEEELEELPQQEPPPPPEDPFEVKISIEEERPKYDTEVRKKEFVSRVTRPSPEWDIRKQRPEEGEQEIRAKERRKRLENALDIETVVSKKDADPDPDGKKQRQDRKADRKLYRLVAKFERFKDLDVIQREPVSRPKMETLMSTVRKEKIPPQNETIRKIPPSDDSFRIQSGTVDPKPKRMVVPEDDGIKELGAKTKVPHKMLEFDSPVKKDEEKSSEPSERKHIDDGKYDMQGGIDYDPGMDAERRKVRIPDEKRSREKKTDPMDRVRVPQTRPKSDPMQFREKKTDPMDRVRIPKITPKGEDPMRFIEKKMDPMDRVRKSSKSRNDDLMKYRERSTDRFDRTRTRDRMDMDITRGMR